VGRYQTSRNQKCERKKKTLGSHVTDKGKKVEIRARVKSCAGKRLSVVVNGSDPSFFWENDEHRDLSSVRRYQNCGVGGGDTEVARVKIYQNQQKT